MTDKERASEFDMSLRDWFAGQASERDIAVHQYYYFEGKDRRRSREQAKYVYADKMMQARRQGDEYRDKEAER